MNYEQKYKKYKIKYLDLKKELESQNSSLKISLPPVNNKPPSAPSSPSSQGDDHSENSSVLSIDELSDPNIIIVSNILYEIH